MDVSGLGNIYNKYNEIYGEKNQSINKLQDKLQNTDYKNETEEELMKVCKDFEAYFVEQAFKALKNMVPESDMDKGEYMKYFGDNLIQEYASTAVNTGEGFGLANMLYEQMKRNYGIGTINTENVPAEGTIDNTEQVNSAEIAENTEGIAD